MSTCLNLCVLSTFVKHYTIIWVFIFIDSCHINVVGDFVCREMASTGLAGTLSPSIGNLSHLKTM